MADATVIQAALVRMDPNNDNHWTMEGLAKLDTVKFLAKTSIDRTELDIIAPGFNRESLREHLAKTGASNVAAATAKPTSDDDRPDGITGEPDPLNAKSQEMADRSRDRTVEASAVAEEIRLANEEIEAQRIIHHNANVAIVALQDKLDKLQAYLIKIAPRPPTMSVIQAHLNHNRQLQAARSGVRQRVADSGVDIGALQSAFKPSPIDSAMRNRPRQR